MEKKSVTLVHRVHRWHKISPWQNNSCKRTIIDVARKEVSYRYLIETVFGRSKQINLPLFQINRTQTLLFLLQVELKNSRSASGTSPSHEEWTWETRQQSHPCRCWASLHSKFTVNGGSSGEALITMWHDSGSGKVTESFTLATWPGACRK